MLNKILRHVSIDIILVQVIIILLCCYFVMYVPEAITIDTSEFWYDYAKSSIAYADTQKLISEEIEHIKFKQDMLMEDIVHPKPNIKIIFSEIPNFAKILTDRDLLLVQALYRTFEVDMRTVIDRYLDTSSIVFHNFVRPFISIKTHHNMFFEWTKQHEHIVGKHNNIEDLIHMYASEHVLKFDNSSMILVIILDFVFLLVITLPLTALCFTRN